MLDKLAAITHDCFTGGLTAANVNVVYSLPNSTGLSKVLIGERLDY